jgi:ribA/ribD-fused uncharacterized protein
MNNYSFIIEAKLNDYQNFFKKNINELNYNINKLDILEFYSTKDNDTGFLSNWYITPIYTYVPPLIAFKYIISMFNSFNINIDNSTDLSPQACNYNITGYCPNYMDAHEDNIKIFNYSSIYIGDNDKQVEINIAALKYAGITDENILKYAKGFKVNNSEICIMFCKALIMCDFNIATKLMNNSLTLLPKDTKIYGKSILNFNQRHWDNSIEIIALDIITQKFENNLNLKSKLINIGKNKLITESTINDNIWGIGIDKSQFKIININEWISTFKGYNILGFALMKYINNIT